MTVYCVEWEWAPGQFDEVEFATLRQAWREFWRRARLSDTVGVTLDMEPHPFRPWEPTLTLVEWNAEGSPAVEFELAEPGLEWWHYGKPWGGWYGEVKEWCVYVKEERRIIESAPQIESVEDQPWEPLEYPA